MLSAALRETYEETGIRVAPLMLNIATRATPQQLPADKTPRTNPQVTEGYRSTEYIAAILYPDPQSDTDAFKAVFYFAATADSTVSPQSGTQESWEQLEASWAPISEASKLLRFDYEVAAVGKAVEDVKRTGYSIGA